MVQKKGNWLPHDLMERTIERRKTTCDILLKRYKRKSFLHRIDTGEENWIHYDNSKRKKASGEAAQSKQKANIYDSKLMLSIWISGGCHILRGHETVRSLPTTNDQIGSCCQR